MIGYVTLGTNDMQRACAFYDELLATIGRGGILAAWNDWVYWSRIARARGCRQLFQKPNRHFDVS